MGKAIMLGIAITIMVAAIVAATLCGFLIPEDPLPPNRVTISGSQVKVMWNDDAVIRGQLGVTLEEDGRTACSTGGSVVECQEWPSVAKLEVRIEEDEQATCHHFKWSASSTTTILQDCYHIDDAHWFGGAAIFNQHWPINEWEEPMTIYGSASIYRSPTWYGSLLERYWVSSKGVAIRVSHNTPLYVSINDNGDGKICFRGDINYNEDSYTTYHNPDDRTPILDYKICRADNIRVVHEYMTNRFTKKPTGLPDIRMMRSPVWSTWARYKKFVTNDTILGFAHEIVDHGFNNSQLEIDDGYSGGNFGDFIFDPKRIPDPAGMIQELHDLGFRVTIWITPFANPDTTAWKVGNRLGYWVKNADGSTAEVQWWNGRYAGMLDVTNPDAVEWFVSRLNKTRADYGIDSFKFDAGETQFLGYYHTQELLTTPCEYTTKWVELAVRLGSMIEVRSSFENQEQPVFLRMMDKDSKWGWDNGLKTMITTALTYSVLGYSYVLPDMIGGNGYPGFGRGLPEPELYVRWLQITAFLTSMQYSYSPWQYNKTITDIALRWTSFHENVVTPKMVELAETEYIPEGKPLVRPLWWIAPTDPETYVIDSQFLVGDDWLVAPILEDGARSRDVYLPAGRWRDNIHDEVYDFSERGEWLREVDCELDEILYFSKL